MSSAARKTASQGRILETISKTHGKILRIWVFFDVFHRLCWTARRARVVLRLHKETGKKTTAFGYVFSFIIGWETRIGRRLSKIAIFLFFDSFHNVCFP
jgi:hypothetical protein